MRVFMPPETLGRRLRILAIQCGTGKIRIINATGPDWLAIMLKGREMNLKNFGQ